MQEDVANCFGACRTRLGGYQRARDADRQKLLVGFRPVFSADEIPPADAFVFVEPSLLATAHDAPDAASKMFDILKRDLIARRDGIEKCLQGVAHLCEIAWKALRQHDARLVIKGHKHARSVHQIILYCALVVVGDARHRVGDVLVKIRKKPETMFTRQPWALLVG